MRDEEQNGFEALRTVQKPVSRPVSRPIVPYPPKTRRFVAFLRPHLSGITQYALFLGGLSATTYGFYMIYRPLGPIVGGLIAVSLGMLLSSEPDESSRKSTPGR